MGFIVFFITNMYRFNTKGWIFSSVLLVVSIYLLIVGYKKGIKKGIKKGSLDNKYNTFWQVIFILNAMLLLYVLFSFYVHFSSFQFPFYSSPF